MQLMQNPVIIPISYPDLGRELLYNIVSLTTKHIQFTIGNSPGVQLFHNVRLSVFDA